MTAPKAPKASDTTDTASTPAPAAATKPKSAAAPQIVTGALPAGFTLPEPKRGGAATYPVDSLEVGGAFGVKNKTKRDMATIVMRANKKYRTEGVDPTTRKTKVISTEREFYAVDVDADTAASLVGTPFEGSTVLVVRSK